MFRKSSASTWGPLSIGLPLPLNARPIEIQGFERLKPENLNFQTTSTSYLEMPTISRSNAAYVKWVNSCRMDHTDRKTSKTIEHTRFWRPGRKSDRANMRLCGPGHTFDAETTRLCGPGHGLHREDMRCCEPNLMCGKWFKVVATMISIRRADSGLNICKVIAGTLHPRLPGMNLVCAQSDIC